MVVTANLTMGGLRSPQTVDLQVRRWSPKERRLGQTVDLQVRRWPPKGLGHECGRNGHHTRGAPRGDTGGRQRVGPHERGGVRPHTTPPGNTHRQPHPSYTS